MGARYDQGSRPWRPRKCDLDEPGVRRAGPGGPGEVDFGRSHPGADANPDAQANLAAQHSWCLNPESNHQGTKARNRNSILTWCLGALVVNLIARLDRLGWREDGGTTYQRYFARPARRDGSSREAGWGGSAR